MAGAVAEAVAEAATDSLEAERTLANRESLAGKLTEKELTPAEAQAELEAAPETLEVEQAATDCG